MCQTIIPQYAMPKLLYPRRYFISINPKQLSTSTAKTISTNNTVNWKIEQQHEAVVHWCYCFREVLFQKACLLFTSLSSMENYFLQNRHEKWSKTHLILTGYTCVEDWHVMLRAQHHIPYYNHTAFFHHCLCSFRSLFISHRVWMTIETYNLRHENPKGLLSYIQLH